MTVTELIDHLQKMPKDAVVVCASLVRGWDNVTELSLTALMTTDKADYIESVGDFVDFETKVGVYTKTDDHKLCEVVIIR